MSQSTVEQVIGKMLLDAEFRKLITIDMEHALAGYDLTDAEREGLKNIDPVDFDRAIAGLDRRVSKGFQSN